MLLLLVYQHCHAYIFGVSGNVQVFDQGAAYYTVDAYASGFGIYDQTVTDENGDFSFYFDIPDGTNPVINLSTYDYCSYSNNIQSVTAFPGNATANLLVCDPNISCYSHFYVEPALGDPFTMQFVDNSWVLNGNYLWDFGDGNTSTLTSPTHTYDSPGYKYVSLTVSTPNCADTSGYWLLIGDPAACNCPTYYTPYCYTLPDGTPVSFINECEANCFGYPDATACYDSSFCYVYFGSTPDSLQPNLLSFHTLIFGEPISYLWDFGDGTTSTEPNPTHLFPAGDGGYLVQVTITTASGCTASNYSTLYLGAGCDCPTVYAPVCFQNALGTEIVLTNGCYADCLGITDYENCNGATYCAADFGVSLIDSASFTYQFADNSYGEDISYQWYFGDGGSSTEQNPTHSYQTEGVYIVGLTITTSDSCTAYQTYHLMVGDGQLNCFAYFGYEYSLQDSFAVSFTDYSISFAGSQILSWEWNFGDGATSTEQNPVHTYAGTGFYDVSLNITTADSCSSSLLMNVPVDIYPGLPTCYAYFWLEQSPNDSLNFQFMDMSSSTASAWYWSFGDGSSSTEQNPTHTYTEPGVYLVSLTVTDSINNCTNAYSMLVQSDYDIYYGGACQALFIPQVNGLDVQFYDFSFPLPAAEYLWDFGDGNTSTDANPLHQYQQTGVYTVLLTITTTDGCTSSFSVTMDLAQGNFWGNSEPSALFITTSSTDEAAKTGLSELRLFPNPASEVANLSFTNVNENEPLHLTLHNATGQMVWTANIQSIRGTQLVQIPTAGLPAGLYLLQLSGNSGQQTLKLVRE